MAIFFVLRTVHTSVQQFYKDHFSTTATATKARTDCLNSLSTTASLRIIHERCMQNSIFFFFFIAKGQRNLIRTAPRWCLSLFYFCILKELSHGILSYFGHVQNYLQIEGDLKMIVYYVRKTAKR